MILSGHDFVFITIIAVNPQAVIGSLNICEPGHESMGAPASGTAFVLRSVPFNHRSAGLRHGDVANYMTAPQEAPHEFRAEHEFPGGPFMRVRVARWQGRVRATWCRPDTPIKPARLIIRG
jgi:hypothetical protein